MVRPHERGEPTRARILAFVRQHPSTPMRGIAQGVGVDWNIVRHHLRTLAQQGHVQVDDGPGARRVFPAATGIDQRAWLVALRGDAATRVLGLVAAGAQPTRVLRQELGLSRKRLYTILGRLEGAGLVERTGRVPPRYSATLAARGVARAATGVREPPAGAATAGAAAPAGRSPGDAASTGDAP